MVNTVAFALFLMNEVTNDPVFEVSAACVGEIVTEPRVTSPGPVPGVPKEEMVAPFTVEDAESVPSFEQFPAGITMLKVLLFRVSVGLTNAPAKALIVRVPPHVAVPVKPNVTVPPEELVVLLVKPVVPVEIDQKLGLPVREVAADVTTTVGFACEFEIVDVVAIVGATGSVFVTVIV